MDDTKVIYIACAVLCARLLFFMTFSALEVPDSLVQIAQVGGGSSQIAFPGAEGFGRFAKGGRGGQVLFVTNLNDSGPGSFRAAVTASGPRTVVFRVGGTIPLQSEIRITNPYLTIAGQTAPGGGITLKNGGTIRGRFVSVLTHDVIVRHIRFRPGPNTDGHPNGSNIDGFNISTGSHDVIFDHVSVSWATDENTSVFADAHDITIQWSIISEGLYCSTHYETVNPPPPGEQTEAPSFACPNNGIPGSKGLLVANYDGDPNTLSDDLHPDRISIHHNLFAHNLRRQPQITSRSLADVVNNVVYDHGIRAMSSKRSGYNTRINFVNNYIKAGPSSDFSETEPKFGLSLLGNIVSEAWVTNGFIGPNAVYIYEAGNVTPSPMQGMVPTHWTTDAWRSPSRFSAPSVSETSAQVAYGEVLAKAGATLPARDTADIRIVSDVQNGTGRKVNDPSEVGGWPVLAMGTAPQDSDNDGMADSWETPRGFTVGVNDSAQDADGDGYTNLEEYINYIVDPTSFPDPQTGGSQGVSSDQTEDNEISQTPETDMPLEAETMEDPQSSQENSGESVPSSQTPQLPQISPKVTEEPRAPVAQEQSARRFSVSIPRSQEDAVEAVANIKKRIVLVTDSITAPTTLKNFIEGLRTVFAFPIAGYLLLSLAVVLYAINSKHRGILKAIFVASVGFFLFGVLTDVSFILPQSVLVAVQSGIIALGAAYYLGFLAPVISFALPGIVFSRETALIVVFFELLLVTILVGIIFSGVLAV